MSKDDNIATLVSAMGLFYGETIINKMEKLEAAKGKEVTCDALVKISMQSVQGYWIWEGYCRSSNRDEIG